MTIRRSKEVKFDLPYIVSNEWERNRSRCDCFANQMLIKCSRLRKNKDIRMVVVLMGVPIISIMLCVVWDALGWNMLYMNME